MINLKTKKMSQSINVISDRVGEVALQIERFVGYTRSDASNGLPKEQLHKQITEMLNALDSLAFGLTGLQIRNKELLLNRVGELKGFIAEGKRTLSEGILLRIVKQLREIQGFIEPTKYNY